MNFKSEQKILFCFEEIKGIEIRIEKFDENLTSDSQQNQLVKTLNFEGELLDVIIHKIII